MNLREIEDRNIRGEDPALRDLYLTLVGKEEHSLSLRSLIVGGHKRYWYQSEKPSFIIRPTSCAWDRLMGVEIQFMDGWAALLEYFHSCELTPVREGMVLLLDMSEWYPFLTSILPESAERSIW